MKGFERLLFLFALALLLLNTACDSFVKQPSIPQKKITKDSFADLTSVPAAHKSLSSTLTPMAVKTEAGLQSPLYPPVFYQKISVSFTDAMPLKDILPPLSKTIGIDLQLDLKESPSLFFEANHRPFIEIIEDICEMAQLRFSIKNNRIRIEPDSPYSHVYPIQFLNLTRNSQNRMSIATNMYSNNASAIDVSSASGETQKSSVASSSTYQDASNGSDSHLNVESANDFWAELETNLSLLLASFEIDKVSKKGEGVYASKKYKQKGSHTKSPYFSIHKQGGLLTVYANAKAHKRIAEYLERLKRAASSQVLIEAKIIEVSLNNEFKSGIDWSTPNKFSTGLLAAPFGSMSQSNQVGDASSNTTNALKLGIINTSPSAFPSFSAILSMLEHFGHTRTLSSPRLTVMNNQAAILKVAKNEVYFRINYDKQLPTVANTTSSSSVSSTIQTVPIGLIMAVQPSINIDTGEIILFLRPTISKSTKTVSDPAVSIAYNANLSTAGNETPPPSIVPVVEVREIDSVMKLKDGEIGVLGGLMEVSSHEDSNSVPFLGDAPVLDTLFSSKNKGDRVVELVILLKVTIAKNDEDGGMMRQTALNPADERLRKEYVADPRKW